MYSGDHKTLTVKQHLTNIESHAPLANWSDEVKIQVAKARTSGDPQKIITNDPDFQKRMTWAQFKSLMIERFHPFKTTPDKAVELFGKKMVKPDEYSLVQFIIARERQYMYIYINLRGDTCIYQRI